jgi:hypothetical protein
MSILMVLSLLPHASAFKVIDQAMCKYVDPISHECKERTNQFDLTDEWAFFWFRGTMETSDAGAKEAKFNLYGSDGQQFLGGPFVIPFVSPVAAPKPGENVVGWIGIGISKANVAVGLMPGISFTGTIMAINGRPVGPASEKPGEWQVEFTLDGRVVVSERFRIGEAITTAATPTTTATTPPTIATTPIVTGTETQPRAVGLQSNLLLIALVVVVILVVVGITLFALRHRAAAKISPSTLVSNSRQ